MPAVSPDARQTLKTSISRWGFLGQVLEDENHDLLDGYTGLDLVEELEREGHEPIEVPVKTVTGIPVQEKRSFVRTFNSGRRHLNQEQTRQLIRDELLEHPTDANRVIATKLGVSHVTVAAVRSGLEAEGQLDRLTSSVGADGKTRRLPTRNVAADAQQTPAIGLKRGQSAATDTVTAAVPAADIGRYRADLRVGQYADALADIGKDTVSLIYTAPPDTVQTEDDWLRWCSFAQDVLRPGGIVLAYCRNALIPRATDCLSEFLEYVCTIAVFNSDVAPMLSGSKTGLWVPLLVYGKAEYRGRPEASFDDKFTYSDTYCRGDGSNADTITLHEAEHFITVFSRKDEVVLDPFARSASIPYAALSKERQFVGCCQYKYTQESCVCEFEALKAKAAR